MGNSRKSRPPDDVVKAFAKRTFSRGNRVALGLSGGLDSIVLLHILKEIEASAGFSLSCIHVNHKISKNSGSWAKFCEDKCSILDVPLRIEEVDIAPHLSCGLEAAARTARYSVFDRQDVDYVVLAQHQDDQAETVLLQLFRGAGLNGLAAMGESMTFGKKKLVRPLLSVPRKALEAYALDKNLEWIEDESNADIRHDRNFVRHRLLPVIEARFPSFRETIFRSAGNIAEAMTLLDELAEIDASNAINEGRLDASRLIELPRSRAKNLLRHYLFYNGMRMPSSERLDEMLKQLTGKGALVSISHDGFEIRRYRGFVHAAKPIPVSPGLRKIWGGESRMAIPELGGLIVFETGEAGLDPERLSEPMTVRVREGGERFRIHGKRPSRLLKNLFQEKGIPPWLRNSLPLLYCGERLVWVPGVGIDPEYRAGPGKNGLNPRWQPQFSDIGRKA